mmetsp:Transcript_12486/g.29595  ORF Transcript_12486/g.29595 Transcript_12486/m.29595 type:complete len:100 (-) Transcript_12486:45-344(-)|eukprot:CAMPEP_0197178262 /NCGR_PEP_ID=MMETSP1423-20130617/3601_1 /TAXON_ID=476441 /ORGANISM="Pseudo-nitzschia heimii, Strain UNC1101" /LENGTH=99 /DNA_ID=CAMNT_0042627969 /DNA_START=285 /DNA_END=584 /DNA_ORIENTATION=-
MAEVANAPVVEETPLEEQAPVEEPIKEVKKETSLTDEGTKKKSLIALIFSCFGSKSQVVVLEKPVDQEQTKEDPDILIEEKRTEDSAAKDKPNENSAKK